MDKQKNSQSLGHSKKSVDSKSTSQKNQNTVLNPQKKVIPHGVKSSNQNLNDKKENKIKTSIFNINKSKSKKLKDDDLKKIEELQKSFRYLQADFANFKKTSLKENQIIQQYGIFNFVQDLLLNVVNDFNRAIEKTWEEQNMKDFQKGVEIIHQKLIHHLSKFNIKEICPKKGDVFDPYLHEVIGSVENENVPSNHIIDVCRKGYKLHDRLVQAAQVIVSKEQSVEKQDVEKEHS